MASLYQILFLVLGAVKFIIFAHLIISWLVSFEVLNIHQPSVRKIWDGLSRFLEPFYRPIRRILPEMGGLDLSPVVAILIIYVIEIILKNNASLFY